MLIQIAALTALILISVVLSPVYAIAVICTCVLLLVYPVQTILAIALAALAHALGNQLTQRKRRGIRRLPRSRH